MELVKRIESERLVTLQKQKQLLDTKKKLRAPIALARTKLEAKLVHEDGKITEIHVPYVKDPFKGLHKYNVFNATQIAEMADQHEADKVLTKALKEDKNKS